MHVYLNFKNVTQWLGLLQITEQYKEFFPTCLDCSPKLKHVMCIIFLQTRSMLSFTGLNTESC